MADGTTTAEAPPAPRGVESSGAGGGRFIFVGGAPRSGTTLVQNILDCHPEILGGPEFINLGRIVELRNRMQQGIAQGATDSFASAAETDRLFARLIEDLLLPLADRHGAPYLSEKTPSNVLVFRELAALFPAARAIFVLRDPRAVVASMLEVGRRAAARDRRAQPWTRSLPAAVDYVRLCLDSGFDAADALPGRLHVVTYEALVTEPEAETRRLCDFLGLAWTEAMLSPSAKAHLGETPITSTSVWYDRDSFRRDPDPAGIGKWQTGLGPRAKGLVTLAFAGMPRLAAYGYALAPRDLSGREYALGLGARLVERTRRRLRRAVLGGA